MVMVVSSMMVSASSGVLTVSVARALMWSVRSSVIVVYFLFVV